MTIMISKLLPFVTFASIWYLSQIGNADTFQSATSVYKDIVLYSNITITNGCNSIDCNRTCPNRDKFPSKFDDLLTNKGVDCLGIDDGDLPLHSDRTAQAVSFHDGANCTSINSSVNPNDKGFFSLSFWINARCTSKTQCNVLRYGDVKVTSTTDSALVISNPSGSHNVSIDGSKWTFVNIRYNGVLDWFIEGRHIFNQNVVLSVTNIITIGSEGFSSGEKLAVVDARFYGDVLTDREITAIFKGLTTLENIGPNSECRCPAKSPKALTDTLCTDNESLVLESRLNVDGGYIAYLKDGSNSTVWKSKAKIQESQLTFSLQNIFQVVGISLTNLGPISNKLVVRLLRDGETTQTITFTDKNCETVLNCHTLSEINGRLFELAEDSISNREDLSNFLADSVTFILSSSEDTQFSVGDVKIHVKCHCMGNDQSCTVNGTEYRCNCGSFTTGKHCEECLPEYFREDGEFGCSRNCSCNLSGSVNNTCEQVGGQCLCKPNINESASRICDTCKFNTINLGSDQTNGCTSCSCVPNGIQYCADTGTCVCKNNVKNETGNCESCLPEHYGFGSAAGCQPCGCNRTGAKHTQCEDDTGQCECKTNVAGKQCNRCKDGFYDFKSNSPLGCEQICGCNFVGSLDKEKCEISTGKCSCLEPVTNNGQCSPFIERVFPIYGPVAGGTIITIQGSLLGNPSTSTLKVDIDNSTENVTFWNSSMITLTSTSRSAPKRSKLSILWYKGSLSQRNETYTFEYRDNPILQHSQKFYTYASGGCTLSVQGTKNMNSAYQPKIVVHVNNENIQNGCFEPHLDTEIHCKTPNTSQYNVTGNVSFGFIFDDFKMYETLNSSIGELIIVKDPVVTGFPDTFGNLFDTQIEIKGEFLLVEKTCRSDMRVMIGNKECDITSISETNIICDPREAFPGTNRDEELVVIFGNLHIKPGIISFRDFWNTQGFIYIAVGVGCAVLVVIVIIIICCVLRRKGNNDKRDSLNMPLHERAKKNDYTDHPTAGVVNPSIATIMPFESNGEPKQNISTKDATKDFLDRLSNDVKKKVKASVVERSSIKLGNICTRKGSNMRVINGSFSEESGKAGDCITIKTLISPYPESGEIPDWLTKGFLESIRMRDLIHENILESCGVAIDEKQVYFLYPDTKRTLKDFLSGASDPLTEDKGLDVCVQISEGMNFLDGHQIIHKDLAARNCWVTSNDVVKISDASFTYDLYPDEYLHQNDLHLPVRWMAPESLRQIGFYHSKSDVWSYGVVMWEIFTTGKYLPYHDITDDDHIKDYVCNQGYRLGKPHECSDRIFAVIEQCLGAKSDDRPNFFLISNILTELISPSSPISYVNETELNQTSSPVTDDLDQTVYQNVEVPNLPPRQRR